MKRFRRSRRLILPSLAILLTGLYQMLEPNPAVDRWFTSGISRWSLTRLSDLSNQVGFSIAEYFVGAMVVILIGLTAGLVIALWRRHNRTRAFYRLTNTLAALLIAFLVLWGFNYKAVGPLAQSGLLPMAGSTEQLVALATDLVDQAKRERRLGGFDEVAAVEFTEDLSVSGIAAYERLALRMPDLASPTGRAKPLRSSSLFSQLGITGIFIPFTGEANYNDHQPDLLLPATILHEMAHLKGVAREEEANFLAYLAAQASEEPGIRYSGTMLALIHTVNEVALRDPARARTIRSDYSEGMKLDLSVQRAYWAGFSGPAREWGEELNDSYLRANGQTAGTASYSNMVAYLLAWQAGNCTDQLTN